MVLLLLPSRPLSHLTALRTSSRTRSPLLCPEPSRAKSTSVCTDTHTRMMHNTRERPSATIPLLAWVEKRPCGA